LDGEILLESFERQSPQLAPIDDGAFREHVVAVGHTPNEAEVLLDEQNAGVFAAEPRKDIAELVDDHWRQTFAGLVEHQRNIKQYRQLLESATDEVWRKVLRKRLAEE
jgi:hypothetical protein